MSIHTMKVSLRAIDTDGTIRHDQFVGPLEIQGSEPVDSVVSDEIDQPSFVNFRALSLSEFADKEEPGSAFRAAMNENMHAVGEFFERRSTSLFEQFRKRGLELLVIVEVWVDSDQVKLALTPKFVQGCAHQQLGVEIISRQYTPEPLAEEEAGEIEI